PTFALNTDGYSILSDPLSVLQSWNYDDVTPCSWKGVTCTEIGLPGTPDMFRVTSLVLPNSQLFGSVPEDLGYIEHLRHLDLSNNILNGSLPSSLFNSTQLQVISLSGNEISGELSESVGGMRSLQFLNLSENALAGNIPKNLTTLQNLTVLSLRTNYFSGYVPSGFNSVEVLDLSSNLLNGSLPLDFGGGHLRYLNLSYNKLSGPISEPFAKKIPENATIDLSFNNLTGSIPESMSLLNQKTESFRGNIDLCGKPLKNLCSIPATLSTPPNISTTSPAIAVIPKPLDSTPVTNSPAGTTSNSKTQSKSGLKPVTIVAIAVSDIAGIALLALVILYVYQLRKKKSQNRDTTQAKKEQKLPQETMSVTIQEEPRKPTTWSCLTSKGGETSEATTSDSDPDDHPPQNEATTSSMHSQSETHQQKGGKLVIVDGETELEMETLLKASAYILGASGPSIVYKAVLEDGTAFAVRRIGESGIEKFRDFENHVRFIAKLRHPNLVKIRGFCWGDDEKLVIYDYVSNGSLASSGYSNARVSNSGRNLGLQRSTSGGTVLDHHFTAGHQTPSSSSAANSSAYQAPESLNNLKPNSKWDVYSFGIVLLELLSGRVFLDRELSQWITGSMVEDKNRVLRLADVAIRGDVEATEDALYACFRLGFSCASFVPQKRPSMKEALQVGVL
ncbi:hypothetical protein Tsubulata_015604, partial [Turnera subulata]